MMPSSTAGSMPSSADASRCQIATGVRELAEGLRVCSGYVALALIAYNAGQGNAAYIATQGKAQRRPAGSDAATWETMCRLGSAMLHQAPTAVNVEPGRWRCAT